MGGLGTVYRAHDRELDREVALKQIQERFADRAESRRRFEWEARVTGRLQHPGIVPVYTMGRDADGRPYYAMRFIEGQSLKEAIAAGPGAGADPADRDAWSRELLGRFLNACDAIAYAHSRGVVHRDVKPANIMLGPYGETLVVDWGLAKLIRTADEPATHESASTRCPADDLLGETATGEVVGTPAYMSPEQATGRPDRSAPAGDVYGLGATLFSVLTGRAPVEAGSPREAIDRARRGEVVAPSSVAPGVPRALDAVCRKAMARRPEDRYSTATELADDVRRWLAGAPVSAWREPATLRARRWLRRHRTAVTALAASALVVAVFGMAAWAWQARQAGLRRTRMEQAYMAVRARYDRARSLPRDAAEWRAALAAAQQAAASARDQDDSGPALRLVRLRSEVESAAREAARDRALLDELADVRMSRESSGLAEVDEGYLAVFRRFGADFDASPTSELVAKLSSRPPEVVREATGFLDDWVVVRHRLQRATDRWRRPLQVARAVDPDPERNRVRDALELATKGERREVLLRLAGEARRRAPGVSAPSVLLLAEALDGVGRPREAADLLKLAADSSPTDLWANHDLAFHLERHHPERWEEALRYYTAARALRPDSSHAMAHLLERRGRVGEAVSLFEDLVRLRPDLPRHRSCMGGLLRRAGRDQEGRAALAEAIAAFRAALRDDPDEPTLLNNLGLALQEAGRPGEAVDVFQAALRARPNDPTYLFNLGLSLNDLGRLDEAAGAYRAALAAEPNNARTLNNLGLTLHAARRTAEAAEAYRGAIKADPRLTVAHFNYANVLRELGRHQEAINACRAALAIEPGNAKALNTLGLALAESGRRGEAAEAYRGAIKADPKLTVAHFNYSNVLRALGRHEEALEACRAALKVDPRNAQAHATLGLAMAALGRAREAVDAYRAALKIDPDLPEALCNLGLALRDRGEFAEALVALERGHEIGSARPAGWRYPSALWVEQCRRLLRLEAELPALLGRGLGPEVNRTELAELCYKKSLYSSAARLYAEAFGMEPDLAERPPGRHRYNAACCAALASDGRCAASPPPNLEDRAALRERALGWLADELGAWSRRFQDDPASTRQPLVRTLRHWRADPDLASLRDAESVQAFPEESRAACRAIWSQVDTLLRSADASPK